ncbi:bifunctional demethylmenaquinone methyltransferase/2-methoxy-6-polyprenyl-1,4-benzoquinol methylase UbiE [Candidatus Trichorickettsia mobilis]|uniref:bifunctional demethylmenaquinone methyltransferase/2-methoxy-6-polyprenyl-1,4-benzoquinol methylase UbiE n=1 Tax=Candidatus Trichorickettsia mobilis TaxID=1346319 RepID=UPI00292D637B|nr:bifunctional demethylmenaquinone methyltransferase/2-methoxy-6-polyprenyl-1,4-benzoquinol methylase UbiE [Candidatus Trichorickettsia mobilis]
MINQDDPSTSTNFGFKKTSDSIKQGLVNEIFTDVATKYDLMNDLMSFGIHRLWKDEYVKKIPNLNANILDVAGGTGDISFRIINRAKIRQQHPQIVICDINQEMLKIALARAINNNIIHGLEYVCADAEQLPFANNSFDYYTIAFGIRNVKQIQQALTEAFRVLKPGGKFLCLEFSKVKSDCLQQLYNLYSFNIIPKIGQIVTGNQAAYNYLVESINMFPDQQTFSEMISRAGFSKVHYQNLSFGVVAIHSGYKL